MRHICDLHQSVSAEVVERVLLLPPFFRGRALGPGVPGVGGVRGVAKRVIGILPVGVIHVRVATVIPNGRPTLPGAKLGERRSEWGQPGPRMGGFPNAHAEKQSSEGNREENR